MSKAVDFRTNAVECDQLAAKANDPEAKRLLQEAVANWRLMVEHAERMER